MNRIRYFTARVKPTPNDPQKAQRQQTYLRALATIPNLSIHEGHFLSNVVEAPLANPVAGRPRTAWILRTEEKGSDVNLATYMLLDAYDADYELAVVISNDSDLKTPIEAVRHRLGLTAGVLNPHPNISYALKGVASFYRPIRKGALQASQFPSQVTDAHGSFTKPTGW